MVYQPIRLLHLFKFGQSGQNTKTDSCFRREIDVIIWPNTRLNLNIFWDFPVWLRWERRLFKMKYFCFVLLLVVACSVYCEEEKKEEKEKEKKDAIGTVIGIDLGTTYSWYVFQTFYLIFFMQEKYLKGNHYNLFELLPFFVFLVCAIQSYNC